MIAPDLMTLLYVHKPPGTVTTHRADRLRTWDDASPYHKGRPKRGPRGPGDTLRLLEKDVNWRNIPKIKKVTVHSFIPKAMEDVAYLHVGGAAIQAITGVKPEVKKVKHSVSQWGIREGKPVALVSTMYGDMAYDFVDKCINLVFPKIKDWSGILGSTGDSSGNLGWGFTREGAILFPEVSVNYDVSFFLKSIEIDADRLRCTHQRWFLDSTYWLRRQLPRIDMQDFCSLLWVFHSRGNM